MKQNLLTDRIDLAIQAQPILNLNLSPSDHSKEYKKLRSEIKKKSEVSSRLQKKNKKNSKAPSGSAQKAVDVSVQEVARQYKVGSVGPIHIPKELGCDSIVNFCSLGSFWGPFLGDFLGDFLSFQYKLSRSFKQIILISFTRIPQGPFLGDF